MCVIYVYYILHNITHIYIHIIFTYILYIVYIHINTYYILHVYYTDIYTHNTYMCYIYVLYMNVQHLWTALFSFSLHILLSIPKADARLGFPVFSVSRAEPWPKLLIRCTTGMRPGFRRKSVEKEVLSAMCFLVSVASTADGQIHRGLGHTAECLCSVVEGSLFCALQWYIL